MSNDFKGIPGGDPSRRPQKILLEGSCEVCNATIKVMGKATQMPPVICSTSCKGIKQTKDSIEELKSFGIHLEYNEYRSAYGVNALLEMCKVLRNVKRNKMVHFSGVLTCLTCGGNFHKYSVNSFGNKQFTPSYCSRTCQRHKDKNVTTETKASLCPRPEKVKYNSIEEVEAKLLSLVGVEDFKDTDAVPYLCPCGSWHYGSTQKKNYQVEEKTLLLEKTDEFMAIIAANPNLVYGHEKKNKKKRKRKKPSGTIAA